MEKEGTVKFDGYVIEGASALWCAAGAGKAMFTFFFKYLNKSGNFLKTFCYWFNHPN